jgi:hypothetical protein
VYESNTVPVSGSAFHCMAGHPMAHTFADQISETEALRLQTEGFLDGIRGLHLYGGKVNYAAALALGDRHAGVSRGRLARHHRLGSASGHGARAARMGVAPRPAGPGRGEYQRDRRRRLEHEDIARRHGFDWLWWSNAQMGSKWNAGFAYAADRGADLFVLIGSDNWIHPTAFDRPPQSAISAARSLDFVDLERGVLQHAHGDA